MKAAAFLPFLTTPAGISAGVQGSESIDRPRLKLSLNAYSFNRLLQKGEMDLFQLPEFCAEKVFQIASDAGYRGYLPLEGDPFKKVNPLNKDKGRTHVCGCVHQRY